MKKLFLFPLLILLVIGFILTGCQSTPAPTSAAPTSAAPTTAAPTTAAPTSAAPTSAAPASSTAPTQAAAIKELKIGFVTDFTNSVPYGQAKLMIALVDWYNAQGGIKVGNDIYKINLIEYSNDGDMNKDVSAVNRLVFQDKVKYIMETSTFTDAILPITEQAKVLTFTNTYNWNSGFLEKWHYNYALPGCSSGQVATAKNTIKLHPDITGPNGMLVALPDNAMGHQMTSFCIVPYKNLGCQPQILYYPAGQQDLSALGTKVALINPAWYMADIFDVVGMGNATAAAYNAGYRGHYFSLIDEPAGLLAPVLLPEVLEGFISAAGAASWLPGKTDYAKGMQDAYIAKYGSWEFPDCWSTPDLAAITTAMEKAGSLDVDKVAAVLDSGMTYTCFTGGAKMIKRPDMRLDTLTKDSVTDIFLQEIHNKEGVIVATATADEVEQMVYSYYPALKPGQTPTIVPPQ